MAKKVKSILARLRTADLDDPKVVFGIFVMAPSIIWVTIVLRFAWRRCRKALVARGERKALPSGDFDLLYVGVWA